MPPPAAPQVQGMGVVGSHGVLGAGGRFGHPEHPLLRKCWSVLGPERCHPKANADSQGWGGGPAGLGEPRSPPGQTAS